MIDFHMLDSGKWSENLALQAERIKHPLVTLQLSPPVWGNILEARYNAYQLGTNPYVSWIDDDDEVLDVSWLDSAIELLESDQDVSAVYPRWCAYEGDKLKVMQRIEPWTYLHQRRSPPAAHHMTIMRRKNLMPILERMRTEVGVMVHQQDVCIGISNLKFGRMHYDHSLAYRWNLWPGTGRTLIDTATAQRWAVDFKSECIAAYEARLPS